MSGSTAKFNFPNANINLVDKSVPTIPDPTILPLHLPIFPVFAETGPVGVPILGGVNYLQEIFGTQFLNERSPYFNHQSVFLKRALGYQLVYMVRVADPAATAASLVLLCKVTPRPVVQYQRTASGAIVYGSGGNPLPLLETDGVTPVTQPGVVLNYSTRQLADGETINTVLSINSTSSTIDGMVINISNTAGIPLNTTLSIVIGGVTYIGYVTTIVANTSITLVFTSSITSIITTGAAVTFNYGVTPHTGTVASTTGVISTTYPLFALTTYVGSAGDNFGFRLFYNTSYNTTIVSNTGAMTYNFQPVQLNINTNVETPIYDINNSQTQTFSFMPGSFDPSTDTYYELADVVRNSFNGLPGLPYQFYVYGSNMGSIGQAALTLSPELGSISPYLLNLFTGVDSSGNPYEHIVIAPGASSILNNNVVLYLQGGSDGSLSKSTLEAQTAQLYNGALNPLIADSFRYPFTHIYDSGYTLANKQLLMDIFSIRDDIKIILSTQDVANPANTAAQDQSTGSALRTSALLNPESIDFGTQACRVDIYQQCGTLSDTQLYTNIVPATIDSLIKHCRFTGSDHIVGEPKGRPNSEVSILNIGSLNWTPTTPQQMQLSWNTGLNYIQYCDTATVFYPDLLSVYSIDTSLLSSALLVDYAAVYLKHIIRRQWTIIVGRDDPPRTLFQSIATAIDAAAAYAFNGYISTSTVVSQTAVDTARGYQSTVTTKVSGNMPNRVWDVIVPITRA